MPLIGGDAVVQVGIDDVADTAPQSAVRSPRRRISAAGTQHKQRYPIGKHQPRFLKISWGDHTVLPMSPKSG